MSLELPTLPGARRHPLRSGLAGEIAIDYVLLAVVAGLVSIGAFVWFFRQNEILLYGDAVAHINIARRIFDSRTPGPLQLGTVWLPLPHILMAPFLVSDWAWRTGVGASIPSMLAYVAAGLAIFRLVRRGLEFVGSSAGSARMAAWTAAAILLANPNLVYLQSIAMTETLSLALFLWATVFFGHFVDNMLRYSEFAPEPGPRDSSHAGRALQRCGWCLAGLMLTRYDGWFAAVAFAAAAGAVFIQGARRRGLTATHFLTHWKWKGPLLRFLLIVVAVPATWLAYNELSYGNPLEFATGPYSALAIEQRTRRAGDPQHPGWKAPQVAAMYYLKAAKLNLGEWHRSGATFFPLAIAGTALLISFAPTLSYWLLLWLPVVVYPISIAWGGIPIFVPPWWPYSHYNVRYGLQLLPAVAVFTAVAVYFGLALIRERPWRMLVPSMVIGLVFVCYLHAWVTTPISLREARVNARSRLVLERALAQQLRRLPSKATLAMYLAEHSGALQRAGFPLRRTFNEGDRKIWPRVLSNPAEMADYVIAEDGDPLSRALGRRPVNLQRVKVIETPGQGTVTIYRSLLH